MCLLVNNVLGDKFLTLLDSYLEMTTRNNFGVYIIDFKIPMMKIINIILD